MIERDEGHVYDLAQLGNDEAHTLRFIKRSGGAIQYDEEWAGLQTQEVTRALIRRTLYLNSIIPCHESENAIWNYRMALWEYEARAYRRKLKHVNRKDGTHPDDARMRPWRNQLADDVPFGIEFIEIPYEDGSTAIYDAIEDVPIGDDGHMIIPCPK